MMALAVLSFSHIVVHLFGQSIPNVVLSFFRFAGETVILGTVVIFAFVWLLKARPHNRPKMYFVVIFDVYGSETTIDGIRTEFTTCDVAWSFMKEYKKSYPLHNFALVGDLPKSEKRTIFRYI
jgi:hypothetical protein